MTLTRYEACPQTQRRSRPPCGDQPRLLEQLVSVSSDLDADRRTCIAGGDGGFT
jgi:hypothetical protein